MASDQESDIRVEIHFVSPKPRLTIRFRLQEHANKYYNSLYKARYEVAINKDRVSFSMPAEIKLVRATREHKCGGLIFVCEHRREAESLANLTPLWRHDTGTAELYIKRDWTRRGLDSELENYSSSVAPKANIQGVWKTGPITDLYDPSKD